MSPVKCRQSIGLNMIVKNESHIIESTLEKLCNHFTFSTYIICDTGSTDKTKEIIKRFFDSRKINGVIHDDVWKDFAHNRSSALDKAFKKCDYLLIFDADDTIEGTMDFPNTLDRDAYFFNFGKDVLYKRILLVKNDLKWRFKSVLHEYIECYDKTNLNYGTIEGNYSVDSGKTGNRSIDPYKYLKDALTLEKAYYEALQTKDPLHVRYAFYCAQSYRDCNQKEKAIEWYKKRAELKGWDQEVYFSYHMVGYLYKTLNKMEEAIYYWSLAIDADTERYETIYEMVNHYRILKKFHFANNLIKMIPNLQIKFDDKLFLDRNIYDNLMPLEIIIVLGNCRKWDEAIPIMQKYFQNKSAATHLKSELLNNISVYVPYFTEWVKKDEQRVQCTCFYYQFIGFVQKMHIAKHGFSEQQLKVIDEIIHIFEPLFIQSVPKKYLTFKNKDSPTVLFTMTTCKRLDLMRKTVCSFLHHCLDANKIDYFFCVDDNSKEKDRKAMGAEFPFFEYYMKGPEEKGHRASMNIIWNKLNQLKPKFWVHMEDDFLFFAPNKYIQQSIDYLEKYKGHPQHPVRQILWNKQYAETIFCYPIKGGREFENNELLLHIFNEKVEGRNCAYWPHYSFRPSLTDVETILSLGNFDSPENFFERAYADRYTSNNYHSMYFNNINSIHTGKLTSESNSDKPNAYALNGTEQFNVANKKIAYHITDSDDLTEKDVEKVLEMIFDEKQSILYYSDKVYKRFESVINKITNVQKQCIDSHSDIEKHMLSQNVDFVFMAKSGEKGSDVYNTITNVIVLAFNKYEPHGFMYHIAPQLSKEIPEDQKSNFLQEMITPKEYSELITSMRGFDYKTVVINTSPNGDDLKMIESTYKTIGLKEVDIMNLNDKEKSYKQYFDFFLSGPNKEKNIYFYKIFHALKKSISSPMLFILNGPFALGRNIQNYLLQWFEEKASWDATFLPNKMGFILSNRMINTLLNTIYQVGIQDELEKIIRAICTQNKWSVEEIVMENFNVGTNLLCPVNESNLKAIITTPDSYAFIQKRDHVNDDINHLQNYSFLRAVEYMDSEPNAIGFNSLGFVKNNIVWETLQTPPFFQDKDGIFINVKRYEQKYGKKIDGVP